jgi:hypothetical protein
MLFINQKSSFAVEFLIWAVYTWYGHVQRMAEGRLPKIALKWTPKQRRARGRPKKKWMEGIKKAMNVRNLKEGQWEDRQQWSLGVGQRRKNVSKRAMMMTMSVYKHYV